MVIVVSASIAAIIFLLFKVSVLQSEINYLNQALGNMYRDIGKHDEIIDAKVKYNQAHIEALAKEVGCTFVVVDKKEL